MVVDTRANAKVHKGTPLVMTERFTQHQSIIEFKKTIQGVPSGDVLGTSPLANSRVLEAWANSEGRYYVEVVTGNRRLPGGAGRQFTCKFKVCVFPSLYVDVRRGT